MITLKLVGVSLVWTVSSAFTPKCYVGLDHRVRKGISQQVNH